MGLDITHGCWSGGYSAFMRWRIEIAKVADIPLELMENYYSHDLIDGVENVQPPYIMDRLRRFDAYLPIKWSALKPDVLHVLLNHSDCEGDIAADYCAPLADRLEELLPLLVGDGGGHIGMYRDKTQTFIDGLRLAASLNEAIEFC